MPGPLAGYRILDLTSVLMGPYATQILGDLGADVIKVETLDGDTTRRVGPGRSASMGSNFLHVNRSKRSIALNLRHPAGREAVLRLAATADVLIHNIRPASMRRLGLDYPSVETVNPRIIYCTLSGFGSNGPYAGAPAYDDLIQGLCALPAMAARVTGVPAYVPTPIVDRVGGLSAAIAVVSALLARGRGPGQEIEVPLFESMAHLVVSDHLYGRTFEPPLGPSGYTRLLSPYRRPYRTSDGWLCVLVYTDRHWQEFFRLIERPDLSEDPRFSNMRGRNENIDELYRLVAEAVATRTTAEWLALLRDADIPAAPMHDLDALIDDPHLKAVGLVRVEEHPSEGRIRTIRVPWRWSRTPPEPSRPAPVLGMHGSEVLQEAGYSEQDIEALRAAGVTR